jgi:hypothetical protein
MVLLAVPQQPRREAGHFVDGLKVSALAFHPLHGLEFLFQNDCQLEKMMRFKKFGCFALCGWFLACASSPDPSSAPQGGAGPASSGASSGGGTAPTSGGGAALAGAGGGGVAMAGSVGVAGTDASAGASAGGAAAGGGGSGSGGGGTVEAPNQAAYLKTLYGLVDLLLTTQITNKNDENYGALVSPSTNPDNHAMHSRAAEAVYPLAVAYKHSQDEKYAKAALPLGDWLITLQTQAGSWIEEWPATSGWDGTSADQLISLSNAYVILKGHLTPQEDAAWVGSITRCADWIEANFPKGNINYVPTGAVALLSASRSIASPKASWLTKAASLMLQTTDAINEESLLTGEGMGVDLGYNIAQSIGFIAMYGRMLPSPTHVERAAALMKAHQYFMYPNGAIDNSWGTRSFKWDLESGTKTAPGVFFSFALLADKDPSFQRGAQLALSYLHDHGQDDKGWLVYGPHAFRHATSNPPDNYSTFARAQSIATAVEFAPESAMVGMLPADQKNWLKQFTSVKTGVFRTDKLMGTISAYGAIGSYPRESMARGGSISALWFEGYGSTGFLQVSSPTVYARTEALHMPVEQALLPLTPRIESASGTYYASVLDDKATISMSQDATGVHATTGGALKNVAGTASGTTYSWTYDFAADSFTKEVKVSSAANLRIVEPFVDDTGNQYKLEGADTFTITTMSGSVYQLKVTTSSAPYTLTAGTDRTKYWAPFPGIDCYPLIITPSGSGDFSIKYAVSQTK